MKKQRSRISLSALKLRIPSHIQKDIINLESKLELKFKRSIPGRLLILLTTYGISDNNRKVFPSNLTLANQLGCSERSIQYAKRRLVSSGWLYIEQRTKARRVQRWPGDYNYTNLHMAGRTLLKFLGHLAEKVTNIAKQVYNTVKEVVNPSEPKDGDTRMDGYEYNGFTREWFKPKSVLPKFGPHLKPLIEMEA